MQAPRIRHVMAHAGRLLLPPVCLICGQGGREGLDCCPGCESDLPCIGHLCRRCGLALPHAAELCGRCGRRPPAFDATWPAFAYDGVVETLIQRFKFRHDLAAGRVLASLSARRLAALGAPRPDCLVPVPLHWRRRLRRGFNQSDLLATDLGRCLGRIPVAPLLRRVRATPAQSALPAERRGGNVRGAFRTGMRLPRVRCAALVDDVMTTGSTLNECARALKRAGVERVEIWVVARA